jgi:photosystem II stability/assembly factor-like uncharacterized protein
VLTVPTTASLRGLHVPDDRTVWASGSDGTWLRTADGGRTWTSGRVTGAEALDFRDVHGFDDRTALLLSAGAPGRIYRTTDGGASWQLVHADDRPEIFFDGMDFWDEGDGLAFGDPIDGRVVLLCTTDGGQSWSAAPSSTLPEALAGEAGFAASGTGIAAGRQGAVLIGLGGATGHGTARALRSTDRGRTWSVVTTPMRSGESAGIFSIALLDGRNGVAVGGDYRRPDEANGTAAWTDDGGATWSLVDGHPPRGYRSGVAVATALGTGVLVAVGTSGSDLSLDSGRTWSALGEQGFNAVAFGPSRVGWAVGPDGLVARLDVP